MKLSNLNIKKIKFNEVDDNYPAEDILLKLGELYQYESGIFGYGNIWTKMERNVKDIIIDELDKAGCIECVFPAIHPKKYWEMSNRWETYLNTGTMFTINDGDNEYGLAPTAEEVAAIFGANRLPSHKNLPAVYYQVTEKYRNEMRPRGYLFRPKIFTMLDAYSFDKDEESFKETFDKMNNVYKRIFERLKLDAKPSISDGGDIGGDESVEYQVITKLGEDKILHDEEKDIFINEEVLDAVKEKYDINEEKLKAYNSVEVGNNFNLGTKYSEPMGLYYTTEENEKAPYHMGCYGIGLGRIVAAIIENNALYNEDGSLKGFSIPKNIAPYKLQIVYKEDKENTAEGIYNALEELNIKTIIDDRKVSIGMKIKDAYSLGTPYILIIGDEYDENALEIEETKTGKKHVIKLKDLDKFLLS